MKFGTRQNIITAEQSSVQGEANKMGTDASKKSEVCFGFKIEGKRRKTNICLMIDV